MMSLRKTKTGYNYVTLTDYYRCVTYSHQGRVFEYHHLWSCPIIQSISICTGFNQLACLD